MDLTEQREHLWFLESINRIDRAMHGTDDLERMLGDVLEAVREVFAGDRAWLLHPCDPDAPSWRVVMERTGPELDRAAERGRDLPVTADAAGLARAALQSRRALLAGPGHELEVKPEAAERFGARSRMLMSIHPTRDEPYLFGLDQCSRPRTWTKGEERLFEEIGHRLTAALDSLLALRSLRENEVELREAMQRYRTVFEKANDAIFLENDRDQIVEVNERGCALLGYSRDELLHMSVSDLQAPEVRGHAGRVIRGEIEKHGSATFESLDLHRSGRRIAVEVTNTRISHRGEQLTLSIVRDVTERKRAEEELRASEARFRTFVDHATDAFFLHDDRLIVVDVNRQACESLGYSREELVGMHPREFDARLDEASVAVLAERVGAGETVTFETLHRRKDGAVFPVEIRVRLFEGRDRRFRISLARDISERKRAEEALRSKEDALQTVRAELARLSRVTMLGELTASIAHEVNQPLAAMVANVGACRRWLAANPPNIEKVRLTLEAIGAEGRRASEVIGRIRALVKRQPVQKVPLDLNLKIVQVIALVEQELRGHGIALETRLAEPLPAVAGDRVQLQQVLLNLILNAIEAMSAVHDRPRELTIVSRLDGAGAAIVEVRDSGSGFGAERAERLFEPFYTTKAEGIGIGLSISRSIVEAHGGRLSAEPNSPHGAVFRFSLPGVEPD